jgi:DNA-binding HxlR family transcriptional regulator
MSQRDIASLLRLLGPGASGSILLALGDGPLRTKELVERVPGYAARTTYRYLGRLTDIAVIEREEEPGVPSKVINRLADPCGVDLYEMVEAYAQASLEHLSDGTLVSGSWESLTLLADLWESGMFKELNARACTATELARVDHELSFHQVSRRIKLFLLDGLIQETPGKGRRRRYKLTEEACRQTALIAGLGRWRERHVVPAGEPGLTMEETAELLRAALPLVVLPEHIGKSFKLAITSPHPGGREEETLVWAKVKRNGAVACCAGPVAHTDGWGRGNVKAWIDILVQGASDGVDVSGGDRSLIEAGLRGMHAALWRPQEPEM